MKGRHDMLFELLIISLSVFPLLLTLDKKSWHRYISCFCSYLTATPRFMDWLLLGGMALLKCI